MEKFEKKEAHPLEKYIGRLAKLSDDELKLMGYGCDGLPAVGCSCNEFEVVGYSRSEPTGEPLLIVEASPFGGWTDLDPDDVIFKECEGYWYANIIDLID